MALDSPQPVYTITGCNAGIAQLVEHNLAKVGVASSNLVSRSKQLVPEPRLIAGVFTLGTCHMSASMAGWQSGYAAACKAVAGGAIPPSAAIFSSTSRRTLCRIPCARFCPGGEIGRRKGLKIPRWQHRAGSIPAPGTNTASSNVHQAGAGRPHCSYMSSIFHNHPSVPQGQSVHPYGSCHLSILIEAAL